MLALRGDAWLLEMHDEGTQVVIEDRRRRVRWRLDAQTRLVSRGLARFDHAPYAGANVPLDAPDVGQLPAESWTSITP